jgi:AcrR family transcriptional regulator
MPLLSTNNIFVLLDFACIRKGTNMKKQPEITERTRQNLIDAFWQLYCLKRIDNITVKEITDKAGYNRGTFYEYFSDVYDVLEQIEDSLLPNFEELPPRILPSPELSLPINVFVKMYEKHSKYYVVLLGDNGDPSFQSKMKNRLKPMLLQAFGGTNGAQDDFRLDYTIEYILSAMIGILSYWFRQENRPPINDLISLMYDLLMNDGILNKVKF